MSINKTPGHGGGAKGTEDSLVGKDLPPYARHAVWGAYSNGDPVCYNDTILPLILPFMLAPAFEFLHCMARVWVDDCQEITRLGKRIDPPWGYNGRKCRHRRKVVSIPIILVGCKNTCVSLLMREISAKNEMVFRPFSSLQRERL